MAVSVQKTTGGCKEARGIAIYELASPSVVHITSRSYLNYRFMGAVLEEGTGSGFGSNAEGHIVTNYLAAQPTRCAACRAPASRAAQLDRSNLRKGTAKNPT